MGRRKMKEGPTASTLTAYSLQERSLRAIPFEKATSNYLEEIRCPREETFYFQALRESLFTIREPILYSMWSIYSSVLTEHPEKIVVEAITAGRVFTAMYGLFQVRKEPKVSETELTIANAYKDVEEVLAIYTQKYRQELQVIVLLSIERYDDDLMYKLLNIEYDLQKENREPLLAFSYIPKVYINKRDIVHPNALLIFEK